MKVVNAPTQPTTYTYDILNNLTTVNQGVQTRSFVYDSLSRLKTATNPESGTISYGYDNNGNLTTKTDARSITTTYSYDALNRVISRSYNDNNVTPAVSYFYDNLQNAKGKLIKVSSSVSTTEYTSFDILGRVLAHKQTTDGQVYNTAYSYNLSGALIEETYPSGRVVKNVLDNDGDLSIVQSSKNSASGLFNYAKNFTYTAAGAVSSMQLGNGKWESTSFNARLQPTQIALGTTQNGTDKLKLNFDYGTTTNNGNVLSQTITVPTTGQAAGFAATQVYTYDSLNRLKSAEETTPNQAGWKQTFLYDRYGNRNFDAANTTTLGSCPTAQCNPSVDVLNNRFTSGQGYTYDLAGNVVMDAQGRTFVYDAENKQTSVSSSGNSLGTYFYDGDGKRVKKVAGTETTIFVYDASGKMVAEYATTGSPTPQVSYLTSDHLGSPRITTDANGNVFSRRDFMPFGEEITSATTGQRNVNLNYGEDGLRQKFTLYERDTETNLDFAKNRYHNYNLGRFTSPDPYKIVAEIEFEKTEEKARTKLNNYLSKPQQWNGYAYTINNPLKFTDPTGEYIHLTGSDAEVQEKLKRLNDFLGDERFNLIKKSADGRFLFLDDGNICGSNCSKFANIGDTAETKDFSKKFAAILSSSKAVRFNIGVEMFYKPSTGPVDERGKPKIRDIRTESGGGVTVPTNESMSGDIEVWVAPYAAQAGNTQASGRDTSNLTMDGSQLRFPDNTVVDSHEFGHAYDLLNGLPDGTNSVPFENAARANRNGTQRRKSEH